MIALRPLILALFILCFACAESFANDREQAPFGLKWAASIEDIKGLGVELTELKEKTEGAVFSGRKLPLMIADVEAVFLYFGYNNKLWRVAAISRSYSNDPSGFAVKNRYQELAKLLADKYGRGRPLEQQDPEMWKKSNEFVAGLKLGRTYWYVDHDTPDLKIQLSLGASDFSTSYWRLVFENKKLKQEFDQQNKKREKDAL